MSAVKIVLFLFFLAIAFSAAFVIALEPYGATVTPGTPETAQPDNPGSNNAYAGNVTELTISGFTTTQSWQGYFGGISGTIQLADASDNIMYNWSAASPDGEIYASVNGSNLQWTSIQCFNFTATGSYVNDTLGGITSVNGSNLSKIEASFNINASDVDGLDETFSQLGSGHDLFYTAGKEFSAGECPNTQIFDITNQSVDGNFEEALLYEPVTASLVFVTILNNDQPGFDGNNYDFEMLVLEDGHGTDVQSTLYYFYVELE